MESKIRFVLKHRETGLYYGNMKDHTKKLWDAMRFLDAEQYGVWLSVSPHVPKHAGDYELIPIKQTIEESVEHANQKSGTEESEVTARN